MGSSRRIHHFCLLNIIRQSIYYYYFNLLHFRHGMLCDRQTKKNIVNAPISIIWSNICLYIKIDIYFNICLRDVSARARYIFAFCVSVELAKCFIDIIRVQHFSQYMWLSADDDRFCACVFEIMVKFKFVA